MSHKITAKNLQYKLDLPPFLARLRGQQHGGSHDSDRPDPILAARRRPVKPRSASAEAEDAPLVVDEQGNAVEVTIGADGIVQEKEEGEEGEAAAGSGDMKGGDASGDGNAADAGAAAGERLASIGDTRKKRKIGKVIGAGADDEDTEGKDDKSRAEGTTKNGSATAASRETNEKDDPTSAAAAKGKSKKKAKKIKLSFGDEEG